MPESFQEAVDKFSDDPIGLGIIADSMRRTATGVVEFEDTSYKVTLELTPDRAEELVYRIDAYIHPEYTNSRENVTIPYGTHEEAAEVFDTLLERWGLEEATNLEATPPEPDTNPFNETGDETQTEHEEDEGEETVPHQQVLANARKAIVHFLT